MKTPPELDRITDTVLAYRPAKRRTQERVNEAAEEEETKPAEESGSAESEAQQQEGC